MNLSIELRLELAVLNITREQLEAQGAELMEQLLALEAPDKLADPAVSLNLDDFTVEVEVIGFGPTFEEALACADSSIRSAIHAIGVATPGWDVVTRAQNAELVDA